MSQIKMRLKAAAAQILQTELQPYEMWAINLMWLGKEFPENITKVHLANIICFLCKKLEWVEEDYAATSDQSQGNATRDNSENEIPHEFSEMEPRTNKLDVENQRSERFNTVNSKDQGRDDQSISDSLVAFDSTRVKVEVESENSEENQEQFGNHMRVKIKEEPIEPQNDETKPVYKRPIKIFTCPHCDFKCTDSSNFAKHKRIHTNDKPYKCSHCGKGFTQAAHLKAHERFHTGDKPYSCSVCNKRFTQASNLKAHERIHTGDKPYECSECDKKFSDPSALKRHVRVHSDYKPFSCSHCDKSFKQAGHLQSHERTHTGDKPFSCPHCDKRFGQHTHLKTHIRTHTGDKPYACPYCEKKFSQSGDLKKHQNIHHWALVASMEDQNGIPVADNPTSFDFPGLSNSFQVPGTNTEMLSNFKEGVGFQAINQNTQDPLNGGQNLMSNPGFPTENDEEVYPENIGNFLEMNIKEETEDSAPSQSAEPLDQT